MRVVHVMHHSMPGSDGYSIRAKYLLEAQRQHHDVVVLTSPAQGAKALDEVIDGIRYVRTHYEGWERDRVPPAAKHLVFGRVIARRLRRLLAEAPCQMLHAHTPFTVARPVLKLARQARIPMVYEKRNLWEESAAARGKLVGRWPFFQLSKAVDRGVTLRADAVCTITEALKAHTVALGARAEDVFVVGNGVDTDAFVPTPAPHALRERCLAGGDFVVGFVGSFFSFEGLPLLLQAFAGLRAASPGARLVLVGDGEDKPKLEEVRAKLGLGESTWLPGRVPHGEVVGYCASMDVLVYPRLRSSLTEMISPLKPLEPMAMGRCVLGSDVGGIRELIRDGQTGLLFQAGSVESLQRQLRRLFSGEIDVRAIGARARDDVVAHRQWRHMAGVYESAYAHARAASDRRAK